MCARVQLFARCIWRVPLIYIICLGVVCQLGVPGCLLCEQVTEMVQFTRAIDPYRLIDAHSGGDMNAGGDVNDIHTYPYPGNPKPSPTQYGMIGEFGGIGVSALTTLPF